jgi:putative membrane protein
MAQNNESPKDRGTVLAEERTVLAEERTDLALQRTRLAAERTLDAWVRTALSMISFGFTIYKFLQQLQEDLPTPVTHPDAARNIGLALVAMGTLAVPVAIYQHIAFFKQLGLHPFRRPVSLAVIVAAFVGVLGLLVLIGLVADVGPF